MTGQGSDGISVRISMVAGMTERIVSRVLPHDGPDVQGLALPPVLTAEGQDLGHEVFGPLRGLQHRVQVLALVFGLRLIEGHLGVAEDGPQDIVEVMGDASGKGSDGLHFLALAKLVFQVLAFRDIAGNDLDRFPALVDEGDGEDLHMEGRTVQAKVLLFDDGNGVPLFETGKPLPDHGMVVGMMEIPHGQPQKFRGVGCSQLFHAGAVDEDDLFRTVNHNDIGRRFHELAVTLFALEQLLLFFSQLRHVPEENGDPVLAAAQGADFEVPVKAGTVVGEGVVRVIHHAAGDPPIDGRQVRRSQSRKDRLHGPADHVSVTNADDTVSCVVGADH